MSTDTSTLLPNRIGVSDDSLYNLKPSCAKARTYRTSIPATNLTPTGIAPGNQIICYIPSGRRNVYLDAKSSYIRFSVQNVDATAGNNIAFDNNGYSIFNRFDCYHGKYSTSKCTTYLCSRNAIKSISTFRIIYNLWNGSFR